MKELCESTVLCKCLMIIIYSRASSLENSRSVSLHNDLTDGLWYLIPLNPQSSLIVDVVKGQIRAHAALLLSPFFQYLCHIQLLPSLSTRYVLTYYLQEQLEAKIETKGQCTPVGKIS